MFVSLSLFLCGWDRPGGCHGVDPPLEVHEVGAGGVGQVVEQAKDLKMSSMPVREKGMQKEFVKEKK